jgi:nitrogen regulatory protein P-II 1
MSQLATIDSSLRRTAIEHTRFKEDRMIKRIEAIIRTSHLESVIQALQQIGVSGMTIYEARGIGVEKGATISYRGNSSTNRYVTRVKLEIIVSDDIADAVIGAIYQNAYTGEVGDGRILVTSVDEVIRIRTGEFESSRVDAIAE